MRPKLLLALDVDGTLLTREGEVVAADRDALRAATAAGIAVTLASGRLPGGLYDLAAELGLQHPLVGVDGGVLCSPRRRVVLRTAPFVGDVLAPFVAELRARELSVFFTMPDALVGGAADFERRPFVATWTAARVVEDVPEGALNVFAIGAPAPVAEALAWARASSPAALYDFSIATEGLAALRASPPDVDKATGIAHVARRLGLPLDRVACIGDWWNDVPMLRACGLSFAMAGAPAEVGAAARVRLEARAGFGGGVAEAMRILRDQI